MFVKNVHRSIIRKACRKNQDMFFGHPGLYPGSTSWIPAFAGMTSYFSISILTIRLFPTCITVPESLTNASNGA